MGIRHIVLFQFREDAKLEAVNDSSSIREADIDEGSRKNGATHAFIMEFESVEDRDYYVKEDVVHLDFIKAHITSPGTIVEKATVVDIAPGVFS
ncbi:hypothetical protein CDD83_6046 [Cordyceps sp. RAO-2017]|nr:hypothetical protein CDD83_6046 [Cordyceps sp. RAO-2017]